MNRNENKNATEHSASLKDFFFRKMKIDKINIKLKRHEKPKKRKDELSFVLDDKKFRLVDSNGVTSVSVSRIQKRNTQDLIDKYKSVIQKHKQKILKKKYELLFEYQNVENYEDIYKNYIQPHESNIMIHEKSIEDYKNEKQEKEEERRQEREHILKQQEPYELELQSGESMNRDENMKGYVEQQYELYELKRRNIVDSLQVDEKTVASV